MIEFPRTGLTRKDGAIVPLRGVEMTGELLGGTLCMKLRQRYQNVEQQPIEALYTFPVPAAATLVGFVMQCGERRLEASVKEREAAFEAYAEALDAGHGGALLDQERANVFSASVGNLLPGETTTIEVEYIQRIRANEGALRLVLPTLVAPRYIPGAAGGPRTAHGRAEPTTRVPDADRISPPLGDVSYAVSLDLKLPGAMLSVQSPSHRIQTEVSESGAVVRFADPHVPLDRDVVLIAQSAGEAQLTSVVAHKPGADGYFMVSHIPDLAADNAGKAPAAPNLDVVFLLDRSGSMAGDSIVEARRALRLCLRQLREGDRFAMLAFDHALESFRETLVPFTQKTLEAADAWIASIDPAGGTELLAPLLEAVALATGSGAAARRGCVVLLTDGQVGNEDEILRRVAKTEHVPIHSFGIGTNVSDALLVQLGERTQGSCEFIHPGERIDEKVVATFARAIAPAVRNLRAKWLGIKVRELAPADLPPLIDGEPWSLFGRYARAGSGALELRGELDGEPWFQRIPIELPERADVPRLPQLWAAERVREIERVEQRGGRRAEGAKARIVELATEHGIASRYTSFVVIETRAEDRRAKSPAVARPVPVHAPAGWAMFQPPPMVMSAPRSMPGRAYSMSALPAAGSPLPVRFAPSQMLSSLDDDAPVGSPPKYASRGFDASSALTPMEQEVATDAGSLPDDPAFAILASQLASGLWDEPGGKSGKDVRRLRASTEQLAALLRLGVDAAHLQHGALVRKATTALASLAEKLAAREPTLAERAFGIAWLASPGPRTRRTLRDAILRAGLAALASKLDDEPALREMLSI